MAYRGRNNSVCFSLRFRIYRAASPIPGLSNFNPSRIITDLSDKREQRKQARFSSVKKTGEAKSQIFNIKSHFFRLKNTFFAQKIFVFQYFFRTFVRNKRK